MNQPLHPICNVSTLFFGVGLLLSMPVKAELPPTARYARGEEVDLSLIVDEWQRRMPDIPVYACTCTEEVCDTKPRWPLRSYNQNEPLVALGPFNAEYNESKGFACEVLALDDVPESSPDELGPDKSSPGETSSNELTSTTQGTTAKVVNNRRALQISYKGQTRTIDTINWDINIVDALDCDQLEQVPSKRLNVLRLTDYVAVNEFTGQVAVGAILSECVETHQSAVFVVEPVEGENWSVYRLMVPGSKTLPDGASSYPLFSLSGLTYMDGHLLVGENTVADNAALLVFKAGSKTAGTYVDCLELKQGENPSGLCPQR